MVERAGRSRAKLLDAAVIVLAEQGFGSFSLAETERRAGLKRRLAAYHFKTASALLDAALAGLVVNEPLPVELGLQTLVTWVRGRLTAVTARLPEAIATLRLATDPGLSGEIVARRSLYWTTRAAFIAANLARGQVLGEIRADIDPKTVAPVLLGQVHGECLRLITTRAKASATFEEFMLKGLTPEAPAQKPKPKPRDNSRSSPSQPRLFE